MRTRQIERAAQDECVRVYRDAFGLPRLAQPHEREGSGIVVIACAGFLALTYLAAWALR